METCMSFLFDCCDYACPIVEAAMGLLSTARFPISLLSKRTLHTVEAYAVLQYLQQHAPIYKNLMSLYIMYTCIMFRLIAHLLMMFPSPLEAKHYTQLMFHL